MTRGPKEALSAQLRDSLCASLMLNSGFLTLHPHWAWFEAISWRGAPSPTLCRQRQQQAHCLLPSMAHAWSWSCSSGRLLAQGRGSAPRMEGDSSRTGDFSALPWLGHRGCLESPWMLPCSAAVPAVPPPRGCSVGTGSALLLLGELAKPQQSRQAVAPWEEAKISPVPC